MSLAHQNSIINNGLNHVIIEEGRITNVNMKRWTVDVRTNISMSTFLDIQWANPYLHFTGGEGIYFMPEVGAKCLVCRASDSPPFVMSFITTFERNESPTDEDSQAERDLQEGQEQANSNVNFSAGRPDLQQGDIVLRTRDGNTIWLRRGGVVEIGATAISKRIYIPLLNYIRDICENYAMFTFGGDLSWTVSRSEDDPDGEAKALLSVLAKDAAQDQKASVAIKIGHVDDEKLLSISIAPEDIDLETREVSNPVYEITVDRSGNLDAYVASDVTTTVAGGLTMTISGSVTQEFGAHSMNVSGDQSISISGSHTLTANSSHERLSGSKTITAPSLKLGGSGASSPAVKGDVLLSYLGSLAAALTAGGVAAPTPPTSMLSNKIRID